MIHVLCVLRVVKPVHTAINSKHQFVVVKRLVVVYVKPIEVQPSFINLPRHAHAHQVLYLSATWLCRRRLTDTLIADRATFGLCTSGLPCTWPLHWWLRTDREEDGIYSSSSPSYA